MFGKKSTVLAEVLFCEFHVLYQFQCSQILLLLIPDSIIGHEKSPAALVHPDRYLVQIPCSEFSDNSANPFFDLRRVTGEDLPAQCHAGTFEYLGAFVEITIDIIDVYEGNLQRNRIQHGGQL